MIIQTAKYIFKYNKFLQSLTITRADGFEFFKSDFVVLNHDDNSCRFYLHTLEHRVLLWSVALKDIEYCNDKAIMFNEKDEPRFEKITNCQHTSTIIHFLTKQPYCTVCNQSLAFK